MKHLEENYDIVVVGAGHAGCEAALAGARLGLSTIMFTVSAESIALMPCNPNVGGSSKGHLVRELDALGGEMGKNIDKTFIQSKMLNCSKGPAVHSLRAQADKQAYSNEMRKTLENQENLTIRQGEVTKLLVEDGKITGVKTYSGAVYHCKAVVLCTGTYLKARCIYGDVSNYTGPNGLQAANYLTDSLKELGIEMFRFKTGTPARIAGNTIDYSKMEEQFGDERVVPFSFSTDPEDVQIEQKSCWLTYTNEATHDIIRANLDRSPLYSGMIEGTGPRYCPSIEDKVVRFADKKRHQVFIEPEGMYTNEMYIGGMSSSLPEDVQEEMYHSVPGLEHAKIVKNAYAIEYDCINPRQLYPTLEFKKIKGLFSGGQFNGSSGYATTPSTVPPCCCGRWSVEACWAVRPARVSTITPSKRPADKNVGKESFPPRRFSIFLCSSCTRCAPASTRRPAAPPRPASGAGPPPPGPLSGCHTGSPSALRRPPGTQGPGQWRYMSHIDLQN